MPVPRDAMLIFLIIVIIVMMAFEAMGIVTIA